MAKHMRHLLEIGIPAATIQVAAVCRRTCDVNPANAARLAAARAPVFRLATGAPPYRYSASDMPIWMSWRRVGPCAMNSASRFWPSLIGKG